MLYLGGLQHPPQHSLKLFHLWKKDSAPLSPLFGYHALVSIYGINEGTDTRVIYCVTHTTLVLISKYCVCYFASKQTSPILARVTNHTGQSKYRVCKTRLVGNTSPKPNRKYTIPSIKDVILCLWNMKKLEINRCYQSNQNFFSESIYHVWNGCHAPINLLYMIFSNNTHTLDAQQLRGWDRCWYKQSNVIYRTYIVKYGELVLYLVKFARIIIFTDFTSIITYGN